VTNFQREAANWIDQKIEGYWAIGGEHMIKEFPKESLFSLLLIAAQWGKDWNAVNTVVAQDACEVECD